MTVVISIENLCKSSRLHQTDGAENNLFRIPRVINEQTLASFAVKKS